MRKSVIRRGVESKESVVAKFGLVEKAPRKTVAMIGGVPCKLKGNEWVAMTKVTV